MQPLGIPVADRPDPIFVECLRCSHRAVLDVDRLGKYGIRPNVTIAELSRSLVCQECGSRSTRAFRGVADRAEEFTAG
jgi:hypothetical protein